MAGYSARQSTFTTGDTITAAHSNNEFNAILAAFNVSTGHKHDGSTAGDGGPISTLFSNAISMGTGADTDIALTFNANTNDGVLTWMEDEDYFKFSDEVLIDGTEKLLFRDTALYINSSTDGQLDLVADTKIQLTATTIGLSGAISGTAMKDEDNMSSNSASHLASQQSIKAYVDTEISGISTSFILEDDDGTEVSIASGKEVKFIGSGVTTNWTDTSNGTDGDPYDLTFTINAAQTGITSLLATDIKIGEDNETKIDFEDANEIHFYAANAEQVYIADGIFGPQTDSDVDLGATGVRWKDAYIDTVTTTGNVTVGGDLTISGDDLTMATNTAGNLLIADGTNYNPTAVTDLSEISTVASGDVLLAIDASGGGLKKITRSTLVSGLATSSGIANIVEDSTPQLGGNLDAQDKSITDVGILGYSYGASGSPIVLTVTVASKTSGHPYNGDGSSSAYFLDGAESPAINFRGADSVTSSSGYYYKFDQADGSNSGHPLRFYLDAAKTIAYTTGVTTSGTPGSSGAHTTIAVTDQTPSTLYYQCSAHAYMGNYASVDSANITSSGAVSIDAVGDVTIDADGGDIIFKDAGTTFGSATNTSGNLILKSGTTTALTFSGANATVAGNLIVTGDHTVNGTTTTVNSTTVTIDDPIFTLGGDSAPGSDDNKDRGIEFRWHNGSGAKLGFFGYDDSASAFTFIPDATNSSEVFSGTAGNVIFGNITGTLQTAAQTNITSVGALDGGSITSGFGAIDVGSSNITTTGAVSGGTLAGTLNANQLSGTVANARLDADLQALAGLTSAADKGIQFTGSGTAGVYDLTAAGKALLDDADAAAQRTTLGLGTSATQAVGTSASNVVQLDGSAKLPAVDGSALTGLAGGGIETFTAKGAIANGKPVVLTAEGKAEQVVAFKRNFQKQENYHITSASPTSYGQMQIAGNGSGTLCAVVADGATGEIPKVVIGTINSSHVVTWGTPINLTSSATDGVAVYYDPDNTCFVAIMTLESAAEAYAAKITFSGTTATLAATSSALTTNMSASTGHVNAQYDVDNNKGHILFGGPTNRMSTLALSGTTFTWGGLSGTWGNTGNGTPINHSYVAGSYDVGLLTFSDADNSTRPTAMAYTVSGNTFTFGTKVVLKTETINDVHVGHSNGLIDGNGIICAWAKTNGASEQSYAIITLSGTGNRTVTVTKQDVFVRTPSARYYSTSESYAASGSYANSSQIGIYNTVDKHHYISYHDYEHYYAPKARIIKYISNTEIEVETEYLNDNDQQNLYHGHIALSGVSNGVVLLVKNAQEGSTYSTGSMALTYCHNTTNLTPTNFLGLAGEAIADGSSGKITILGGVNASQSSLTPGKPYYVSENASGSAIATQGIRFIGNAFSATKLQVGEETKKALPTKSSHKIEGEAFIAKQAFTEVGQGVAMSRDGSGEVNPLAGPIEDLTYYAPGHGTNNPDAIDFTSSYTSGTNTYTGTGTSHGTEAVFGYAGGNIDKHHTKVVNYDPDQDRMWMMYLDQQDGYKVHHVIALWNPGVYGFDGTTQTNNYLDHYGYGTYSYTAPVESFGGSGLPDVNSSQHDICYDSDNQKWVVVYNDLYTTGSLLVRTGTLVGGTTNTITWSSPVTFTDDHNTFAGTAWLSCEYNSKEKVVMVAYEDVGDNEYGKMKTISIAANGTPSWNSGSITFEEARVSYVQLVWNSTRNIMNVTFEDHGNSSYIKFKAFRYYSADDSPSFRGESEYNTSITTGSLMSNVIWSSLTNRYVFCYYTSNQPQVRSYTSTSNQGDVAHYATLNLLTNESSTTDSTTWANPVIDENPNNGKLTTVWLRQNSNIKYKHAYWSGAYYYADGGDVRNASNSRNGYAAYTYGHRMVWHPIANSTRSDGGHMFYAVAGSAESNSQTAAAGPMTQHIDNNHQQYIGLAQNTASAGEVVYVKTYGMIDNNQRAVSLSSEDSQTGYGKAVYPFRVYWDRDNDKITMQNNRGSTGQNQMAGIQLSPEKMMVIFTTGADYDGGTNSYDHIMDDLSGPRN